ncbi:MAG: FAD-dependent oxidoreductase [Pseudomonadota bacterium]|nr:FAD-dependent oxidoreductase [Pseudomonadota bacterium]
MGGRLLLAGAETVRESGSLVEGAIISGKRVAEHLKQIRRI